MASGLEVQLQSQLQALQIQSRQTQSQPDYLSVKIPRSQASTILKMIIKDQDKTNPELTNTISYLVDNGASPDDAMEFAVKSGDILLTNYLFNKGARVTEDLYCLAAELGNYEEFIFLISRETKPLNISLEKGIKGGNLEIIKIILKNSVVSPNNLLSASRKSMEIFSFLLASTNDDKKVDALVYCIDHGCSLVIVQAFVATKTPLISGEPLLSAIINKHLEIANFLLDMNCCVETQSGYKSNNILYQTLDNNYYDLAVKIMGKKESFDGDYADCLSKMTKKSALNVVKLLLENKKRLNISNRNINEVFGSINLECSDDDVFFIIKLFVEHGCDTQRLGNGLKKRYVNFFKRRNAPRVKCMAQANCSVSGKPIAEDEDYRQCQSGHVISRSEFDKFNSENPVCSTCLESIKDEIYNNSM